MTRMIYLEAVSTAALVSPLDMRAKETEDIMRETEGIR